MHCEEAIRLASIVARQGHMSMTCATNRSAEAESIVAGCYRMSVSMEVPSVRWQSLTGLTGGQSTRRAIASSTRV